MYMERTIDRAEIVEWQFSFCVAIYHFVENNYSGQKHRFLLHIAGMQQSLSGLLAVDSLSLSFQTTN